MLANYAQLPKLTVFVAAVRLGLRNMFHLYQLCRHDFPLPWQHYCLLVFNIFLFPQYLGWLINQYANLAKFSTVFCFPNIFEDG